MNEKKFQTVNLWVAVPIIMQIGILGQLLWGFLGGGWALSWLCTYIGVILCLELVFYNTAINKGYHPIKSLYPILIMLGAAFFFTGGFAFNGWRWSWIGLVLATAGLIFVFIGDRSLSKNQ